MPELYKIKIHQIVSSNHCISSYDGQKVYDKINEQLHLGQIIELDFESIEDMTSAFLNAAIGQLYGKFPNEFLNKHLHVKEGTIDRDDLLLLKRVIDRAKEFFAAKKQ